jgi:hypothetical protein
LLDLVREVLRRKHYSYKKSSIQWIKRFIAFHKMRLPRNLGAPEVEDFFVEIV